MLIQRVKTLIENHEVGGNDVDLQTLMDADSLSYFSHCVDLYFKERGLAKTRKKILFMHNRLPDKTKKRILDLDYKVPEIKKLILEVARAEPSQPRPDLK